MIVYLARDIPAFVIYCVNGESGSSLLIESTDSMIYRLCFNVACMLVHENQLLKFQSIFTGNVTMYMLIRAKLKKVTKTRNLARDHDVGM